MSDGGQSAAFEEWYNGLTARSARRLCKTKEEERLLKDILSAAFMAGAVFGLGNEVFRALMLGEAH